MTKRRWPKGARVARSGQLAVEKVRSARNLPPVDPDRPDDLLPIRVKTRWRCDTYHDHEVRGMPRTNYWLYDDELDGPPPCRICKVPMTLLPGRIEESVVRSPEGAPDGHSSGDPKAGSGQQT